MQLNSKSATNQEPVGPPVYSKGDPSRSPSPAMNGNGRLPAVEIQGLRKVYQQIIAVDDISLVTYRGEAFGFLGPNGAGKSTVVKILTGLVAPTKGTVRVLGQPINHVESRRRIGYLPEFPSFHRWFKAHDFLEFHGRLYGLRGATLEKRITEVLEMVGLSGRDHQKLGTFSKGMLQRIGLAQALINKPDLVILDELVSGLDPVGQRDMRELLRELREEGTSIFLNSHLLADVEAICDRVAIINQGRILKVGAPAELFDKRKVFEVRVSQVTEELLLRLKSVALSIEMQEDDPNSLQVEVQREGQSADIADIVYACGARLYTLAPRRLSLEQIFFDTIDALKAGN
ncbi:MAG TPA: ABC transporter ATP-binding protein [Ktedonobacteraceae bacterium]|nr:ABC transporter ATP-binding protein [Ktedonobacteraceae bacterium]